MQQCYQDAMAIVRRYGKPDYFITFTCNPNWLEIKANLMPRQSAVDRPDLVCRVFHLKLKALLKDLSDGVLGRMVSLFYVIEFQKRGYHHIMISLNFLNAYVCPETVHGTGTCTCDFERRFNRSRSSLLASSSRSWSLESSTARITVKTVL